MTTTSSRQDVVTCIFLAFIVHDFFKGNLLNSLSNFDKTIQGYAFVCFLPKLFKCQNVELSVVMPTSRGHLNDKRVKSHSVRSFVEDVLFKDYSPFII